MENILIVATMAQSYRLRPVPGHPVEMQAALTLRLRYGMLATPIPRSAT